MGTWVDRRLWEYAEGKKALVAYRKKLDREDPDGKIEASIVSGMVSDLQYGIMYMRTGRRPGSYRGIDKRNAYNRVAYMDIYPSLEPETSVTDEQKRKLVDILLRLSYRERQCYLLHTAQGMSFAATGKELGITKRSVQEYVKRAKQKIGK